MQEPLDRELVEAFQALREEERKGAPAIPAFRPEAVQAGVGWHASPAATRALSRVRWPLATGLAAAAVVTLLFIRHNARETAAFNDVLGIAATELSLGSWKAPSDVLLQYMNQEVYSDIPTIEEPPRLTVEPWQGEPRGEERMQS